LECPSLANTRREILDKIESHFSNLKFFDNKSKFVWLLSADDHYIYNQLYTLLTKLYNKRNDILSSNFSGTPLKMRVTSGAPEW
jgi:hypothetical protein